MAMTGSSKEAGGTQEGEASQPLGNAEAANPQGGHGLLPLLRSTPFPACFASQPGQHGSKEGSPRGPHILAVQAGLMCKSTPGPGRDTSRGKQLRRDRLQKEGTGKAIPKERREPSTHSRERTLPGAPPVV